MPEGSRGTIVIWVVAGLLAVFAVVRLTGSHDGGGGSAVEIERSPGPTAERRVATIFVHVAGAVRQPGLLRLPPGTRVAAAVQRAGGPGPRADLSGVNLAARLEDGQQVVVPVKGAVATGGSVSGTGAALGTGAGSGSGEASGSGAASGALAAGPRPSLGSATLEQLDQIDGIGPTLAQRIIDYRTEHGGFSSIGELREVDGIGEKRFESLRDAVQP